MLARSSSDAATRVRRSKSTSSVYRPVTAPEYFDPAVAQKHAVAAAQSAFVRSHADGVATRYRNPRPEVVRMRSNASRNSIGSQQGSHFPPRESSFKSLPPRQAGQRQSVSRHTRAPTQLLEKFPAFQNTQSADYHHVPVPYPTITISTFDENVRPSSQPKSHRTSVASSVNSHQIRKTRSMFYASTIQTGSPLPRSHANTSHTYLTTPPSMTAAPDVHPSSGRRSAPFSSPLASPRLPVTVAPNETVNQARDRYLQGFQRRQIQKRPSLFLAPFRKRQDNKCKDKAPKPPSSVGDFSTSSRRTRVDTPLEAASNPKAHKDKRSISGSIRNKFKKVFRKSSATIPSTLPVQQIEASREYFSGFANDPPPVSAMTRSLEITSPTEGQIERLRSRTPSSDHERPSTTRSPSRPGSRGSENSIQSDSSFAPSANSRSSSWASSTVRGRLKDRIKNRLSTVPENKNSISSLAGQPIVLERSARELAPNSPLASFQEPMHDSMVEVSIGIDPKRVFSALQREIAATSINQHNTLEHTFETDADVFASMTQQISSDHNDQHAAQISSDLGVSEDYERPTSYRRPESVRGETSAVSRISTRQMIRGTTRSVPGELAPDPVPDRASSVRGAVRIPKPDTAGSPEVSGLDAPVNLSGGPSSTGTIDFTISYENPLRPASRAEHAIIPTPEVLAGRKERVEAKWKGTLKPPHQPAETSAAHALQKDGHKSALGTFARRAFSSRASREQANSKTTSSPAQLADQFDTGDFIEETQYTIVSNTQGPSKSSQLQSPLTHTHDSEPTEIAEDSQYSIKLDSPQPSKVQQPHWPLSPSVYSRNTDGDSYRRNESILSFDGMSDGEEESEGGTIVITSPAFKAMSYPLVRSPDTVRRVGVRPVRPSEEHRNFLRDSLSGLSIDLSSELSQPAHVGHRRELTQISAEEEDTAFLAQSFGSLSGPEDELTPQPVPQAPYSGEEKPHQYQTPRQDSSQSADVPVSQSSKTSASSSRKVPQRPSLNTAPSDGSSRSHQTNNSRRSSVMNDRYPLIGTGRQSKRNSTARSQTSRSTPNSSETSSSRKTTPSSRVYSDYSGAPVTNDTDNMLKHGRNRHSKITGEHDPDINANKEKPIGNDGRPDAPANRGRSMHTKVLLSDREIDAREDAAIKENIMPTPGDKCHVPRYVQAAGALKTPPALSKSRTEAKRSLEGLPNNHGSAAISPYTTSAKDIPFKARVDIVDPQAQRPSRLTRASRTMGRLPLATKSAFELRNSSTPTSISLPLNFSASESPKKRHRHDTLYIVERKPVAGRPLEGETLRMLQESPPGRDSLDMFQDTPWAATGYVDGRDSPLSHPNLAGKQFSHMKTSSSTLALNKEPSPGTEERTIESLLVYPQLSPDRSNHTRSREYLSDRETPSRAGSITPSYVTPLSYNSYARSTGRDTPGHRMAESFVRQREAGSGVGTPVNVSPVNQPNVVAFPAFFDPVRDRSDTSSPVFL